MVSGSSAPALTTVDSEERSALLEAHATGTAIFSDVDDAVIDPHDPTQQLLSALRQFDDALGAVDQSGGLWADECMNHLITGVEVALGQGWSAVVEALTDTGRILQTYESASRATECVPFMLEAYETLCQMMGDMITGEDQIDTLPRWRALYHEAVRAVESAGLVLAEDEDDSPLTEKDDVTMEAHDSGPTKEVPFDMPTSDENDKDGWEYEDDLPVLEELPALETLLSVRVDSQPKQEENRAEPAPDAGADEADLFTSVENATHLAEDSTDDARAEDEAAEAESAPDESTSALREPSPMVVEILDRLCDQLAAIEKEQGDARALAMERFEGGLSALEREAGTSGHDRASQLCELMQRTFSVGTLDPNKIELGVVDMAYAFCGVYMDAMEESEFAGVGVWQRECEGFLHKLENAVAVDDEVADEQLKAEETPSGIVEIDDDADAAEEAQSSGADDESVEIEAEPAGSGDADMVGAVMSAGEADSRYESKDVDVPDLDKFTGAVGDETPSPVAEPTSTQLLESAQRAAAQGDAASAKLFALQAAANIAGAESAKAGDRLHEAEERMRENLKSSESARDAVKTAEECVALCAKNVTAGEKDRASAHKNIADATQELEDLKSGVSGLEEEIRSLQARRDDEQEKVGAAANTKTKLEAKGEDMDTQLGALNRGEEEARTGLERCRQDVNDLQRNTAEIESEMEAARDFLATQKASQADMDQMLEHLRGDDDSGQSSSMLF